MGLINLVIEDLKARGFRQDQRYGRLWDPVLGLIIFEADLIAALEDYGVEDIPRLLLKGSVGSSGEGWGLSKVVLQEALIPSLQRILARGVNDG